MFLGGAPAARSFSVEGRKVMKGDVSDGGVPAALGCCSIEGRRHRLHGGGGGGGGGGYFFWRGFLGGSGGGLFLNPHQTVSIVRSRYFLHENLGFSPTIFCTAERRLRRAVRFCTFFEKRTAFRQKPRPENLPAYPGQPLNCVFLKYGI